MAAKKTYTFEEIMDMKEAPFIALVKELGKMADLDEIAGRTTPQKVYPRVLKPMKYDKKHPENYDPNKMTYQADKTKKPTIKQKPITFFEVKTCFAKEVLGLTVKVKKSNPTFRDRIAAAAQNA